MLLIGFAIVGGQISAVANRSKLRNVVSHEFSTSPNVSVEEISANTGISIKDIRAIILDLKADGRLRGNFSTSTGEAKSMEVLQPKPVQVSKPPVEESNLFCPNCGTPVSRDSAVYCAYCGSKL
ncbi:MAG: zinc-ribbon domain-containing protein [Candidatus Lokiarchaeota archaeon]|nr:zinc-ribbon domain-containing protein [Candidatus Lokiarchaeota archaeon]